MRHGVTCPAAGLVFSLNQQLVPWSYPLLPWHWIKLSLPQTKHPHLSTGDVVLTGKFDHVTPLPDPLKLSPIACAVEPRGFTWLTWSRCSHSSLLVLHPLCPSLFCTMLIPLARILLVTSLIVSSAITFLRSLPLLLGGHDWFFSSLQVPSPLTSPRSGLWDPKGSTAWGLKAWALGKPS